MVMYVFIDINTKYGDLWCRSVFVWMHVGCMVMGLRVGGSNYAVFTCFFEFSRFFCWKY